MQKLMMSAAAAALVVGLGGVANAACTVGNEREYSDADRGVRSAEVRRDLRQLRSAARILQQYKRDDACGDVVAAIQDIRKGSDERADRPEGKTEGKNRETATWQERNKARIENAKPITEAGGRMRVDELMDADVVGSNGDTIGEIEDVVIADSGKPAFVVLGFGGFLGLGEEQAAVPFSQLRVAVDDDGDRTYFLPMTEEQLKQAPKFKRGDESWMDDEEWRRRNDAFYKG